jgi:penicillin-binding protein 1C
MNGGSGGLLTRRSGIRFTWRRGLIVILLLTAGMWFYLPLPKFNVPYSGVILDRNGELLNATVAADGQWRFPPDSGLPEKYIQAAVVYEDKRFFRHRGVDPLALVRAAWSDLRSAKIVSGGSTLTMQVIRLSRFKKPRTFYEKVVEIIQALRLESYYNKQEIITLYAAHAPYGGNVVGLAAASWRYFGRRPAQLSWAETAMLAVLPNNPALVHPGKNRRILQAKRDNLLDKLQREGMLDSLSCTLAKMEDLPPEPYPLPLLAPHVQSHFRYSTGNIKKANRSSGLLRTTLDINQQLRTDQILKRHHAHLAANGIHNCAAMIVGVDNGQVLAYVGNIFDPQSIDHDPFVDIITAPRSTGSILKPLLYAGMLQSGEILPTQLIADVPTRMGGFAPQNYSREYQGAVPAYMALARSLNVPAVNMLRRYGVDRFQMLLKNLGMTTLHRPAHDYGLTLILGGAEGTLWDLTGIYAGLARTVNFHGTDHDKSGSMFFPPLLTLEEVTERSEIIRQNLSKNQTRNLQAAACWTNNLQAAACWLTIQAMLEVARPDEEGYWKDFLSGRRIAWKTGTSYGYRDAWAIGITPRFAVGVWVGNADGEGRPDLVGIKTAAPILFEIFGTLADENWFSCPESELTEIEVCSRSGFRKGPDCREGIYIRVPSAGKQANACPYCRTVHCDRTLQWQVNGNCEPVAEIIHVPWFILPPSMEVYYMLKHSDYRAVPPFRADCYQSTEDMITGSFSIIYPERNSIIYIPRELDGQAGRSVFKAAHRNPSALIYWHLDNSFIGTTRQIHEMALNPSLGEHTLTLVDEFGEQVERKFTTISDTQ